MAANTQSDDLNDDEGLDLEVDEQAAEAAARELAAHLDHPRVSFEPTAMQAAIAEDEAPVDARDEVARFIGAAAARVPAVADALGHVAGALWSALATLEPLRPKPTWRIDHEIRRREDALEWLAYVATTCGDDDEIEVPGGRVPKVPLREAAHGIAIIAELELRRLHAVRNHRVLGQKDPSATAKLHGARGPLAGPQRLRALLAHLAPLTAAGYQRPQIAEIVVASGTWRKPPCPTYVADLLDASDRRRDRAVALLADRMREAERASGGARRSQRKARQRRAM